MQMKKYSLILLTLFILPISGAAQNRSINFESGSFEDILKKAQTENKLVMLDAYTTWCGPCKRMTQTVFTDNKVADFYNTHFINAKFDMEKGEGPKIKDRYEIRAYPTILFINGKGEMVHIGVGWTNPKYFIELGKKAMDTKANLAYYSREFESNKSNPEFIAEYLNILKNAHIPYEEKLNAYWETQKTEDLIEKENWNLFKTFVKDTDSKEFKYLRQNKELFYKKHGKREVEQVIFEIMSATMFNALRAAGKDHQIYFSAKEDLKKLNYHREKEVLLKSDMNFYKIFDKQPDKYTQAAIQETNNKSVLRIALRTIETWTNKAAEEGEDTQNFTELSHKIKAEM